MNIPDAINASFEFGMGAVQVANILRLRRDKTVRGVHWWVTGYTAAWGVFNCFYYPHLGQWISFTCGLGITIANFVWVTLAVTYLRLEQTSATQRP